CQLWDRRRVVRRFGRGLLLAITPCRVAWRSLVAVREVRVNEGREVLRCWLAGDGLHTAAERAGVVRDGGGGQWREEEGGRVCAGRSRWRRPLAAASATAALAHIPVIGAHRIADASRYA